MQCSAQKDYGPENLELDAQRGRRTLWTVEDSSGASTVREPGLLSRDRGRRLEDPSYHCMRASGLTLWFVQHRQRFVRFWNLGSRRCAVAKRRQGLLPPILSKGRARRTAFIVWQYRDPQGELRACMQRIPVRMRRGKGKEVFLPSVLAATGGLLSSEDGRENITRVCGVYGTGQTPAERSRAHAGRAKPEPQFFFRAEVSMSRISANR